MSELAEVQGDSVDIGGYYYPDREKTTAVMRPSKTLNSVLEAHRADAWPYSTVTKAARHKVS